MYDALVLAGGAARRLGGVDKPQLEVDGATLLDRAVAAAGDAGTVIVVGPRQPVAAAVTWCREDPPGGGPVAAVAAGLQHTSADVVLVLAADLPWIAPAVPALVAALADADVALLVDPSGRVNYLAAAWQRPAIVAAIAEVGRVQGAAMGSVVARARRPALVPDTGGWGRDCDTWDDLTRARNRDTSEGAP
ncbi:MAG TPA: NTP transferase domain-containing protein [Jatrophihabitans sp.]|nr:NTP transferase domain-containing protein [Jatrophihabitans sp.]